MLKLRENYIVIAYSLLFIRSVFPQGDRQMTEIFVSGTEVFRDVKMTESPYE